MFGSLPPVLTALLLMAGAVSEYLLPTRYRLTEAGAFADGGIGRLALPWKAVRRVVPLRSGILLSPLPAPSRLDSFRGILLRCAPDGEPGSRAEILTITAQFVPPPVPSTEAQRSETPNGAQRGETPQDAAEC